jgi:carbon-monoxide dehydrogenase medium subunit
LLTFRNYCSAVSGETIRVADRSVTSELLFRIELSDKSSFAAPPIGTTVPLKRAAITLGAVAPTIIHAPEAEAFLAGRTLDPKTIQTAARLVQNTARPIDDLRSSRDYRSEMVRVGALRALRALASGVERAEFPDHSPLLGGGRSLVASALEQSSPLITKDFPIQTVINGQKYTFRDGHRKTLLRLLREDAGLIGTKEGCAEGECGACAVFLDGAVVMSCLVPAERAHGAEIVTIEGLAPSPTTLPPRETPTEGCGTVVPMGGKALHPLQQAFIEEGAVQCGYCTPGFLMSAAKLLEETPQPSHAEIEQAISGNLCRCTGYYKIISAIERAARRMEPAARETFHE